MYLTFRGNELQENLTSEQLDLVINLFQDNPIRQFSNVEFEPSEKEPFDKRKAIAVLQNNHSFSTRLFEGTPNWIGGSLSFDNVRYNIGGIRFSDNYLHQTDLLDITKEYLRKWRSVFPSFTNSDASADDRDNDFWLDVAKTEPLPDCFGSRLGWYHVISPKSYKSFFKREDLLNTPALSVEELDDGTICIQSYAHPLDYSKPDVTKKIIEITNYLTEKWYEYDPSPDFDPISISQ